MNNSYLPHVFLLIFILLVSNGIAQQRIPQLKSSEVETLSTNSAQNEALRNLTVYSPGLEGNILGDSPEREVTVYLPPGYSENPNHRYPVIYLLPHWELQHDLWFGGVWGDDYNIKGMLDNLIKNGSLNPFIVITVDIINKWGGSWCVNSNLTGNWEDYVYKDLIGYIDENFRTLPVAKSRGIGGLGMGGYVSVMMAMKHPDIYSTVYSMNGGNLDLDTAVMSVISRQQIIKAMEYETYNSIPKTSNQEARKSRFWFSQALTFSPDSTAIGYVQWPLTTTRTVVDSVWQKWLEHDPTMLATSYKDKLLNLKAIALEYAELNPPTVTEGTTIFSKKLKKLGVPHELRITSGDFNYVLTNRMYSHVFPFFSNNLEQPFVKIEMEPCVNLADSVKTEFAIDGTLHVVPFDTEENSTSITAASLKSIPVEAFSKITFKVEDLETNVYKLIGISEEGYISPAVLFSVIDDSPEVKINVTDFTTNEALASAVITVNDQELVTDENGELTIPTCDENSFTIGLADYYSEDTTLFVIEDTPLNITLVRDSYLKVIDKASGEPIQSVSVRHGSEARNTDANGMVTMQNLKDGMLGYRTFISGYFTQQDTIPCNPGDTAVVMLTRKKANVQLLVTDEYGPLTNQSLLFEGENYVTNEAGIALVTNVAAREEHSYSLESECYTAVADTFYVELDTLVQVVLQSKTTSPEFTVEHMGGDSLSVTVSAGGKLYLVPPGTATNPDSIAANQISQMNLSAGETTIIHLADLPVGENYWMVYVIDNCQGISKWESVMVNAETVFTGKVKIYPSPVKDILNIETPGLNVYSVKLTNMAGIQLHHKIISGHDYQVNLSGISTGIYFITVESDNYAVTQKIIKR